MEDVMYTCYIIYDMVVESRRESNSGTQNTRVTCLQGYVGSLVTLITEPETLREASVFWMEPLDEKESPQIHDQLKNALASMVWEHKGSSADFSYME
jgi:23S rRNA A1618 N6-methylase RlmF